MGGLVGEGRGHPNAITHWGVFSGGRGRRGVAGVWAAGWPLGRLAAVNNQGEGGPSLGMQSQRRALPAQLSSPPVAYQGEADPHYISIS